MTREEAWALFAAKAMEKFTFFDSARGVAEGLAERDEVAGKRAARFAGEMADKMLVEFDKRWAIPSAGPYR